MVLKSTKLDTEALLLEETLFHTANGYLGVRGNMEEGFDDPKSIRGTYINGFYDTVDLSYPERLYGFPVQAQRMINLPDIQTIKIIFDGNELSPLINKPAEYERTLDTKEGIAKRHLIYTVGEGTLSVIYTRMASFCRPELFLTVLEITSKNLSGKLELKAGINCDVRNYTNPDDPRVAAESVRHIIMDDAKTLDDGGYVCCSTSASELEVALLQRYKATGMDISTRATATGVEINLTTHINTNKKYSIEKYSILSDSIRQPKPVEYALGAADEYIKAGAGALLAEQKDYMDEFWHVAAIKTEGNKEVEDTLEFNLFQLLQSTGRDGITSTASKGISGEGYEGHYFWDTEIYIFPFFLFTKPEIAKALLTYRHSIINRARENALIMGHKSGALYSWRTISGSECSSYFPSGAAQYHINGDIAYSFMQYWYATGDIEFMAQKGAEVLIETARLWLDVGHYSADGRFLLHCVTGPDEYTCMINNNYYTNRCAQANLKGAVTVYEMLWQQNAAGHAEQATGITQEEINLFEKAADAMWLPYDEALDINPQDDSFLEKPVWDIAKTPNDKFPLLLHHHPMHLYRFQVCKQADTVLAHILFEDGIKDSTKRNSFDYYQRISTHDSSLSRCAFGIMAARLGLENKAYEYFYDTLITDLENTHGNTKDGLHTANLGGSWMVTVMGFAGMRLNEKGLHFKFMQPGMWNRTCFKINYLGRIINVQMERDKSKLSLEKGQPVDIYVNDEKIRLNQTPLELPHT
ncbi:MAG: family 65 glycosyl hydrolase [Oscillospiraceae bacterium]|nr:family 65 glycosyl hydrolase [Oscillospiraceae bacterium]